MCRHGGGRAICAVTGNSSRLPAAVGVSYLGKVGGLARCTMLGVLGRVWGPGYRWGVGRTPNSKYSGFGEDRGTRSPSEERRLRARPDTMQVWGGNTLGWNVWGGGGRWPPQDAPRKEAQLPAAKPSPFSSETC